VKRDLYVVAIPMHVDVVNVLYQWIYANHYLSKLLDIFWRRCFDEELRKKVRA
jgi:hypothetical protein